MAQMNWEEDEQGEPGEPEQASCRTCGRDWDIGNGIAKGDDLCLDHNCWVAAGRAKATPRERALAWRWIFMAAVAREYPTKKRIRGYWRKQAENNK